MGARPLSSSGQAPESAHGSPLLPSRRAERSQLADARGRKLEQTLRGIPGVSDAHVLLTFPEPAPLLGDGEPSPGKASVVLGYTTEVAPLSDVEVRRLVAGAAHGIEESRVTVLSRRVPARVQGAATTQDLVHFGPVAVTRSSAGAARTLIAVAIGTAMTLLTVVIGLWLRLRREHS